MTASYERPPPSARWTIVPRTDPGADEPPFWRTLFRTRGDWATMTGMDVLSSRTLLLPTDRRRSVAFYRDTLGLAVYREFGDRADPGVVFFLGGGLLEISRTGDGRGLGDVCLWLQVRDLPSEHRRLADLGVPIARPPAREPWGLDEMWIADPDGVRIVLVEVPGEHPIRRDTR